MANEHNRFWEIISAIPACMVTTADGNVLRARPMATFIDTDARKIRFVTDDDSAKVGELIADNDLCLTFADTKSMLYASVSGKGRINSDRALIKELWGPYCEVFFPGGPENSNVVVIEIEPTQAEYWDNDKGKVAIAAEMAKAYFSEHGPDLGENAKLQL